MTISKNSNMAEIIHYNFQLIPIISRFGIPLGFGDKSVEEVCKANQVNPDLFIVIVNAFNNPDYSPIDKVDHIPARMLVEYLRKSHTYFNTEKLPLIEHLIDQLEWDVTSGQKNKEILKRFFSRYRKEVIEHTDNEDNEVYPYILFLAECKEKLIRGDHIENFIPKKTIKEYRDSHDELGSALLDLKNIILKYLPSPINRDITDKILMEIFRLEKDMDEHTGLENSILIPMAVKIEKELLKAGYIK